MTVRPSLALLAALCVTASTGCSSFTCGANQRKLAELREGMNYEEVSRIMGCTRGYYAMYATRSIGSRIRRVPGKSGTRCR